jgi:hypothetical protein
MRNWIRVSCKATSGTTQRRIHTNTTSVMADNPWTPHRTRSASADHSASANWQVLVLGSGSSASTPKINCVITKRTKCVCNAVPFNPFNHRLNPSILLFNRSEEDMARTAILVDCGKTFREAVIKHFPPNGITGVNNILLTHAHMDAIGGLDDLREVQDYNTRANVYCHSETEPVLKKVFPYMFPSTKGKLKGLFVPKITLSLLESFKQLNLNGVEIMSIPLRHGNMMSLGFIFNVPDSKTQFVYFSDFRGEHLFDGEESESKGPAGSAPKLTQADYDNLTIFYEPEKALPLLKRKPISTMIMDGLHNINGLSYPSHSNIPETLQVILALERKHGIVAQQVYLTGMTCAVDYDETNDFLKEFLKENDSKAKVECGYDGLLFPLQPEDEKPHDMFMSLHSKDSFVNTHHKF